MCGSVYTLWRSDAHAEALTLPASFPQNPAELRDGWGRQAEPRGGFTRGPDTAQPDGTGSIRRSLQSTPHTCLASTWLVRVTALSVSARG